VDFSLTEEQESIVATASAFARDELAPGYREREIRGSLERSLVRRMGELGLIGAELPEELGGLGADYVTSGLIMEAVARGDFNVAYVQLLGSLNAHILAHNMDRAVAAEWIRGICAGERLAGFFAAGLPAGLCNVPSVAAFFLAATCDTWERSHRAMPATK